jgi:outer membrane protein assembly factor BamA
VLQNVGGIIEFQIPSTIVVSDRSGLVIEYRDYTVTDVRENPYLLEGDVLGLDGGVVSGLGLVWVWDVRDHVFFPNFGGITTGRVVFYTGDLGSNYTYSWIELDARRYWGLGDDHVIAAQLYYSGVGGFPPFYKLPALGGSSIMRGYFKGRYRDDHYFAFQVEYRQYFWWKFGFVAFIGAGDVANEITSMQMRHLKPSYGAGLRFLFDEEQKINLRMDIGFGLNTNGIYFGIEEAF